MANLAVLASGNGSNFEVLADALQLRCTRDAYIHSAQVEKHDCVLLIVDRKSAFAVERARRLGLPVRHVSYKGRAREDAESEISAYLAEFRVDLVALAGFMRLLSPNFIRPRQDRIVNVHPSILPNWPGANAIGRAFAAGERVFGVTIHSVDEGLDTGPILHQSSFIPPEGSDLATIEAMIHRLEHELYPEAVLRLLDRIETQRSA